MKTLIVIPARFGSTRFPGKPLAKIAGASMLSRVVDIAKTAMQTKENIELVVATDDMRISEHCDKLAVPSVMTPIECETGTDRALAAIHALQSSPDFIINLQGDVPLMPPAFITALLNEIEGDPSVSMLTPVTQLNWDDLDKLRHNKQTTPFSGTCAILDKHNNAVWFSKNIIPAIRKEAEFRLTSTLSPVFRHIGLYGYSRQLLEQYVTWEPSHYEQLEGLEQLRVLEQGHTIRCVKVTSNRPTLSGIDSPEDIERAEALIAAHGELLADKNEVNV
ncbi:MAG: 3-deoxy-manno-octulosonate cytidylyltransferase [Gammaproteobacteria bacterium]|nr:3-deoxy-manno-octulosonate cytidylyltransferase [Gammaproteobacteria bacterium]